MTLRLALALPPLGLALAGLIACSEPVSPLTPDAGGTADSGRSADSGRRDVDASTATTTLEAGDLVEDLCGEIRVLGSVDIPAGADVTVCAGSTLVLSTDARITVTGTLRLAGEADARVQLTGDRRWAGLVVTGTLAADFTDLYDAELAIDGQPGSEIRFDDGLVYARATQSVRLRNGGTFDRSVIFGGSTVSVTGGVLSMTDSEIDLDHPAASPDCTHFADSTVRLDHVRITNCHCPLHIESTNAPISITNSVFDGAAIPMMISSSTGAFHGNVLVGQSAQIQDIGGDIDLDVSGNFFDGDAPRLDTDDASQFTGIEDSLSARPANVGPR